MRRTVRRSDGARRAHLLGGGITVVGDEDVLYEDVEFGICAEFPGELPVFRDPFGEVFGVKEARSALSGCPGAGSEPVNAAMSE